MCHVEPCMHVPNEKVRCRMARRSPLVVATHRLIDKQKNVSELLPATESHLRSLESLENDFEASLQSAKDHVESHFALLTDAVNRRQTLLIHALDETASHIKESVSIYKRKTSGMIKKAEEALESANKLLEEQKHDPFFRGYSSTSQLLEESFMDMLLLADSQSGDEVSKYTALLSDLKLDISEQLKSLQELHIPVGEVRNYNISALELYPPFNSSWTVKNSLQLPAKWISTTFSQTGEKDSLETSSESSDSTAFPNKQLDKISPEKSPEPTEQAVAVTACSLPSDCISESSCEVVSPESLPDSHGDESYPQPDEKDNTEVSLKPSTNHILESSDTPKTSDTETSGTDTSTTETSAAETSAAETSAAETSAAQTSAAETSAAETNATETSAAETSAAETSAAETSAAETSVAETSVAETSVAATSVVETSATEASATETSAAETSAAGTRTAETSAAETSAAETSAAETSAAETSAAETSAGDTSAAETSTTETSAAETSAAETSAAETSAAETIVAETSVAETSVAETSVAETSVAETSVAETRAAETSAAETSATETSAAETNAAETSAAETSATETSAAEQIEQDKICGNSSANPECGLMQSAKQKVVAKQQQEENPTDGGSDVSHHISLPLVEDVKGCSMHARIEYLNTPPGSQLTVLVTQVTSPSSFSAQPYGPELIQLMEEMGDYYYALAEKGDSGGLLTPPCVGDFCCAQFTEDGCWYRAKVEAVEQLFTTTEGTSIVTSSHTLVQVNYVDYGNHEQLPLTSLRPLEVCFCHLPCQGLTCSLADIHPVMREGRSVPQGTWPPEFCNWFVKLLLGKSVKLTILHCGKWNNLSVDINLPSDVLLSAESLANFPVPIESVANLSSYRHLVTPISLTTFMASTGIARVSGPLMTSLLQMASPLPFLNVPLAAFACAAFAVPTLNSMSTPSDVLIAPAATSLLQLKSDDVETLKSAPPATQKCITDCPQPTDQEVTQETKHQLCEDDHCDSVHSNPELATTQSPSQMQRETTVKVSKDLNVDNDSVPQLDAYKSNTSAHNTVSDLAPLSLQLGSCNDFTIFMSHIVSPSKFFVHLLEEKHVSKMVSLAEGLNDHYSQPSNCVSLVPEQVTVGTMCCLQSPDDGQWCRGLIISVKPSTDASLKEANIFFLDYGDSSQIRSDMLMELDKKFHPIPPQCICCALSGIQPPCPSETKTKQSPTVNASSKHNISQTECSSPLSVNDHSTTDKSITTSPAQYYKHKAVSAVQLGRSYEELLTSDDQQWSAETTKILELLTNGKPLVAVVEVEDSEPSLLTLNSLDVVTVNLYDTTGKTDVHINRELVETQLAEYTGGDIPNSSSSVSSQSPQSPGTLQRLQKWNPMESDFLAERNNYKIDDEDTVSALHGYRSTGRVCRYFTSRSGCFLGSECPYLHLQEGVSDMQLEESFAKTAIDFLLPDVKDWVVVIVTALVSATKFFVQLPLGARSSLSTGSAEGSEADLCLDLDVLIVEMKSYYSHQVFDDHDIFHPHTGEVVAVRYPTDQQWYRGRVIHCDGSSVQVYYVDYGNIDWAPKTELRLMKPEFMNLPFQAVECYLAGVQMSRESITDMSKEEEARTEFEKLVTDKMLAAQVMWKNCSNAMGLLLYDTGRDAGVNIGEVLISKGYFLPCETTPLPYKKSDIVTITLPG